MRTYYMTLPGELNASFQTHCDLDADERSRLYLGAHLPGAAFVDEKPAKIDFSLTHEFAEKTKLISTGTKTSFFTPIADEFDRDVCHLLYALQRKELIKNELYPVHAACVGDENGLKLLIGHSGAGKSTLAQHLIDEHGLKLFSGNKTVIRFDGDEQITALAGTKTMTILDDHLKRVSYELKASDYYDQGVADITSIHLIRLNDAVSEHAKLARSSSIKALHPYFMDAVNADVIVGDYHVFNGAASSKSKHHLHRNLRSALKSIPVYRHAGSLEYLAQRVLSAPS